MCFVGWSSQAPAPCTPAFSSALRCSCARLGSPFCVDVPFLSFLFSPSIGRSSEHREAMCLLWGGALRGKVEARTHARTRWSCAQVGCSSSFSVPLLSSSLSCSLSSLSSPSPSHLLTFFLLIFSFSCPSYSRALCPPFLLLYLPSSALSFYLFPPFLLLCLSSSSVSFPLSLSFFPFPMPSFFLALFRFPLFHFVALLLTLLPSLFLPYPSFALLLTFSFSLSSFSRP